MLGASGRVGAKGKRGGGVFARRIADPVAVSTSAVTAAAPWGGLFSLLERRAVASSHTARREMMAFTKQKSTRRMRYACIRIENKFI